MDANTQQLLDALKLAFSYMPTLPEINRDYVENEQSIRDDVHHVRAVLEENGVDPDKVYDLRSGKLLKESTND